MRVILAALLTAFALASEGGTLVVGVEDTPYYPIYYYDGTHFSGAAAEILESFAKSKGHVIVYKNFPIPRLYKAFVDGLVDYKFPDNEKWQAEVKSGVKVSYSRPVIKYIDGANVLEDKRNAHLSDIRSLGMVIGFTPMGYEGALASGALILGENPSFDGLVEQALAGRIDAAYANVAVIAYIVKKRKRPGSLVFAAGLPHTEDSYRLSSIKHPEMIAEFDQWLADNAALVAGIKAKYGAESGF